MPRRRRRSRPKRKRSGGEPQPKGRPPRKERRPESRKKSRPPKHDPRPELLEIEDIADRMESVLAASPADETEIVWLEVSRGSARRLDRHVELAQRPERTVLVRVLDLGRVGSFRTGASEIGQLSDAVRFAMAQARVREPLAGLPHLPADLAPLASIEPLFDREIAEMTSAKMRSWLLDLPAKREGFEVSWNHARVLVFNSRKVRRKAETTAIGLHVQNGQKAGAGRSLDASRRFDLLDPPSLIERARRRRATGAAGDLPTEPVPVLLSPVATVELVDLLSQTSFSARSYYEGTSFLREHINVQVFDRQLNLRDDGTDAAGLPFPFDLEGTAKHPVDLIHKGAPKTPTLDQRQAAVLGLPPTAHAIGGNNARAENLFLRPGTDSDESLLAAADGGLWIGWLEGVECTDPLRVGFRARARGVRSIEGGALGQAMPDFVWEDSLLRAFSALGGLGAESARRLGDDGYSGGISAPAVALSSVTPGP